MECAVENDPLWAYLPEPVLYQILSYFDYKELLIVGSVCKNWYNGSRDEFLWKRLFYLNFKVDPSLPNIQGNLWYNEFKRLCYNIPLVETETLTNHINEVLHVSFSHNGKYFATCSKDGTVLLWNSNYPATIEHCHDMKDFSWKYTQLSQFNESDTLLLVSGVHFGTPHSTSGEIAVFSIQDDFKLQCRIVSKPYDIFGTWYSDQLLLSGDLHWLAHLISTSVLKLNKASQEVESENIPIIKNMYKFYNRNASSVRNIMIVNCLPNSENAGQLMDIDCAAEKKDNRLERGNPLSHRDIEHFPQAFNQAASSSLGWQDNSDGLDYDSPITYNSDYRDAENSLNRFTDDSDSGDSDFEYDKNNEMSADSVNEEMSESSQDFLSCDASEEPVVQNDKYLIFTTGFKTYTPHQIGFKRIKPFVFPKLIDPGLPLKERLQLREKRKEMQKIAPPPEPDWLDYDAVSDKFDKIDHLIDLHGHIIGMGLSPDHRYLYVNSRPWPEGYTIAHPLDPPPIAQEIDIHVIDLVTLKRVGTMLRAHKAYTPNNECFFIFLDVCNEYVASGAEDKHGYLWDRHYGVCLAKFPHDDVVNSVAFNPKDPEMLVTTSDDYKIKVWRSREKVHRLGLDAAQFPSGIEIRKTRKRSNARVYHH
ncbi:F-box/WD repeat-containing protein 5 isoform X1 [Atheta coriaria]|uniref:F-box/WD repeat-containing protein 5 isoform X1 n=1 Tax=Dalotia coriaria TaxID=877792 RepID=UPI0031F45528